MRKPTPIERAIAAAGGIGELADLIKVARPLVYQWANGIRPVAAKHCIPIENAVGGAVTRYELKPSVFGEAPERAA